MRLSGSLNSSRHLRLLAVALLAAGGSLIAADYAFAGGGGGGGNDRNEGERQEAAQLCGDEARRRVREDGGEDADVTEIRNIEGDGDTYEVELEMTGRYDGEDTEGRVTCEVDLEGEGEVTEFDEDRLTKDN